MPLHLHLEPEVSETYDELLTVFSKTLFLLIYLLVRR